MPGSLLVYNLSWLPRTHSITSTLLSLESEAFPVLLLLILIAQLTLARRDYALHVSNSRSLVTGLSPPGRPFFPSAVV